MTLRPIILCAMLLIALVFFPRVGAQTPSPLRYVALISQTGNNPPTVVVLENTLGVVEWSREASGVYEVALTNGFPAARTFYNGRTQTNNDTPYSYAALQRYSDDVMRFYSMNDGGGGETSFVDGFDNVPIKIIVYPEQ